MITIGKTCNRLRTCLILAALLICALLPGQSAIAQGSVIQNDDFNGSSLNTSIWTEVFNDSTGGTSIGVAGGVLQIAIPADGTSYTFSNTNKRAPRVLQEISDNDFAVEVKFMSSMNVYEDDKIQGILVYDESGDQWLRFDFNTDSDSLNTYLGYIDPGGMLNHIENVSSISSGQENVTLYMRVQYTESSGEWTMSYRIGDSGNFIVKKVFNESNALGSSGFSFSPSHIGLFAGSTGNLNPGHTLLADYFINADQSQPPPLTEKIYLPILGR